MMKKEQTDLISKYVSAAGSLYGVISVSEFVEVFNHYEKEHINPDDTVLALKQLSNKNGTDFCLIGDIIAGPAFNLVHEGCEESIQDFRKAQQGKPRYLPDKNEFLKYIDDSYREPEEPYSALKKYILERNLSSAGEGLSGVDGDMIDLHEMIQCESDISEQINYFMECGYMFKGINDINDFMPLLMDVNNNTRLYSNQGHTPSEVFQKTQRPNLKLSPTEPFQTGPKTGRNEPCPCGSGIKFKKCHG